MLSELKIGRPEGIELTLVHIVLNISIEYGIGFNISGGMGVTSDQVLYLDGRSLYPNRHCLQCDITLRILFQENSA